MQAFLDGTTAVAAEERYGFTGCTVRRFCYGRLKRAEKAVVLRFLEQVSGYSRQQLTRLVKRGAERGPLVKRYRGSRSSFSSIYTWPMFGCWRTPIPCTERPQDRPRRSSWSGPSLNNS